MEGLTHRTHWHLAKRRENEPGPYDIIEWDGNLSLNEGLNAIAALICGDGGTPFNNANTYIGIGDSTAVTAAEQVGLQAATNKYWQVMDSSYPTYGTSQQIVFKVTVAAGNASYAWNEYTVGNSNDDSGDNILRNVEAKGTKAVDEEWTLTAVYVLS
ncbi:MAG: hypothetical protein WC455_23390 [Dehalococcoidia bacterium]|jgi:hypothetical protein